MEEKCSKQVSLFISLQAQQLIFAILGDLGTRLQAKQKMEAQDKSQEKSLKAPAEMVDLNLNHCGCRQNKS